MHIEWEGHVASLPESFDVDMYSVIGGVCYCPLFVFIPVITTTIAKRMVELLLQLVTEWW